MNESEPVFFDEDNLSFEVDESFNGVIKYFESTSPINPIFFELNLHPNKNELYIYLSFISGKGQGTRLFEYIKQISQKFTFNFENVFIISEPTTHDGIRFNEKILASHQNCYYSSIPRFLPYESNHCIVLKVKQIC